MQTICKLIDLLNIAERRRAVILMIMMLAMAFLDMLGVASILPFIAVLANPGLVESNPVLLWAYHVSVELGIGNIDQFLFLLGLLVFVISVFSLVFKALTTYAQMRFALMREYSIGKRLVEGYLYQPYSWFLNRHSADLGKTILSEVQNVMHNGIMSVMAIFSQSAVSIALLGLLILVDPFLAVSVGLVLGIAYAGILAMMSGWLNRLGKVRIKANQERYTVISEAFGAVKEVKAAGLESVYIERFAKPAEAYAKGQSTAQAIAQLPRFALEAIAFGGMLGVILYLMLKGGDFTTVLPIVALYAFAGYRLMPALQQIYVASAHLKFAGPGIKALHADVMSLGKIELNKGTIRPMDIKKSIELKDISYQYLGARLPAINNINLTIPVRTTVAFVGATGSGKTTTIDLILCLLQSKTGSIYVDGNVIDKTNFREWQKNIGYVPQNIYLIDDTVNANIAFGVPPHEIDHIAVEHAAKIANLHDFVSKNMPCGYNTMVGERGVRLSGGQRQRIGIARALYHSPSILVLDEATSALDNLTEQAVMEAVRNLNHSITIILIAHRLSTVRECDQIFLFDKGCIKERGTYQELIERSGIFRAMASNI